jgi:O-6-methylguanine DNA methyltransferase
VINIFPCFSSFIEHRRAKLPHQLQFHAWGANRIIALYVKNIEGIWFGVAYEEDQVLATAFAPSREKTLQDLSNSLRSHVAEYHSGSSSVFGDRVVALLKHVYDGEEITASPFLSTKHLSNYFRKVIQAVSLVPLGYATSYGAVAKAVGGSPRAVGHVMAMNPFAPIVPCHRIVGSNLTLRGYGGGLDAKLDFLKREKQGYTAKREILIDGRKLLVFPVEYVLRKVERSKY